jgi:hypothetical protein
MLIILDEQGRAPLLPLALRNRLYLGEVATDGTIMLTPARAVPATSSTTEEAPSPRGKPSDAVIAMAEVLDQLAIPMEMTFVEVGTFLQQQAADGRAPRTPLLLAAMQARWERPENAHVVADVVKILDDLSIPTNASRSEVAFMLRERKPRIDSPLLAAAVRTRQKRSGT